MNTHINVKPNLLLSNGVKKANCKYCDGLLNSHKNELSSPWNEILYETDNFVVAPTLGSLVEGWLLVISKKHFVSMGEMPEDLIIEMLNLVHFLKESLFGSFNNFTIFEHGPFVEGLSIGCGIDHAHMHLVPLDFSLVEKTRNNSLFNGSFWINTDAFETAKSFYNQKKSYIYICEPNGKSVFCLPQDIPCQSLRRIIASELGISSKYDYKKYAFEENAVRTKEIVCSQLYGRQEVKY